MPLDVDRILSTLTVPEKAALTSGADFWHTKAIDRAGVPAVMMTDGPHGLRRQVEEGGSAEIGQSVPATCFPTAAALASTWDVALLSRVGEALGREAAAQGVAVLLGPGVNIKRTPLCGRNFEYFSEDPHLAGRLAAAMVDGVQSQGVGTSLKHYAANNQETDRMRVSADVDERTLREIYLPAFEHVVKRSQPWTVMCAYNKVNGVYASEHDWLLTTVLRDEWGFEGLVVSDWGAVHDRVVSLAAGLDLQMPATGPRPDDEVAAAVREGRLDEARLDASARRVLELVGRSLTQPGPALDEAAHHELARQAAAAGAVLLKNDAVDGQPLLPVARADVANLLVVGEFARTPRYQGAGSSQVNPTRLDDALSALRAATGAQVPFAAGFTLEGSDEDAALRAEAVAAAGRAGTVLVFLGLPAADESEGYDRPRLGLPENQVALLRALAEVNRRLVVVLANGSAVSVEWADAVPALLETWLGGQAGGSAVAELLLGVRSPEGRLAETIPLRLEDTPAFGNFPGEFGHVRYGEGVLVGYRWYDTRDLPVAFPFGHGLTYTSFAYDDVTVTASGSSVQVSVRLTNTGAVAGAEVVQVYVRDPEAAVLRPARELRGFAKVRLEPGASMTVTFTLGERDLAYWHPALRRWTVEGGTFVIEVGASSRDIRGSVAVEVAGEDVARPLDEMSTVAELLAHPVAGPLLTGAAAATGAEIPEDEMFLAIPIQVAAGFGLLPAGALDELLAQAGGMAGRDL